MAKGKKAKNGKKIDGTVPHRRKRRPELHLRLNPGFVRYLREMAPFFKTQSDAIDSLVHVFYHGVAAVARFNTKEFARRIMFEIEKPRPDKSLIIGHCVAIDALMEMKPIVTPMGPEIESA